MQTMLISSMVIVLPLSYYLTALSHKSSLLSLKIIV